MSCCVLRRQDMMCQGEALVTVLRLLVLMSVTAGGVPKKHFDALRREILHTYGHENVITLSNLQDAGASKRKYIVQLFPQDTFHNAVGCFSSRNWNGPGKSLRFTLRADDAHVPVWSC